jgi:hypothetical protein
MRPQVVFDRGEKPWGFITCCWHHPTGEPRQGLFHQCMPGVVSPCRCRLLQHHGMAHGFHPHQAQTARTGFILRQREVFGWHLASQTRGLCVAVRPDGVLHPTVALVLRPLRGADQAIEACELQEQTPQAHATRTHLDTDQVEREDQAMQEGETWHALAKRHDGGTRVQALLIRPPCLERAAGHLTPLSGLTLGQASRLQSAIRLPYLSMFEAIPALVAILVASLRRLDDWAHSDLLCPRFALVYVMAKDGGVASSFQPFVRSRHGLSGAVIETKWPTP